MYLINEPMCNSKSCRLLISTKNQKMKTKILKIIFLFLIINNQLSAQTKMEIYTNPNIVWAGIVDIDVVIDADSSTNWEYYEISDLGDKLKQFSKDLKPNEKALNEIIIEDVYDIPIYQTDSLKYKYDYNMLDIFYAIENPEYYGYEQKKLPAALADVFRLRCYIYYNKSTLNFEIKPLAVCVLRSENDTGNALSYTEIAWLPVSEWTKMMNIEEDKFTFAKRFYRDIAFENIRVFKQEWTISEVMENMMIVIRKEAGTVELYEKGSLDGEKRLSKEIIELIGLEAVTGFDPLSFEEYLEYASVLSGKDFVGLRLSLDWLWNDLKKSIIVHQTTFAPIHKTNTMTDDALIYELLFIKKID